MEILYNNFEIELVGEFMEDGRLYCEVIKDDKRKEEADCLFWTVYGRKPEGLVDALFDYKLEAGKEAIKVLDFLNHLLDKAGYRGVKNYEV